MLLDHIRYGTNKCGKIASLCGNKQKSSSILSPHDFRKSPYKCPECMLKLAALKKQSRYKSPYKTESFHQGFAC